MRHSGKKAASQIMLKNLRPCHVERRKNRNSIKNISTHILNLSSQEMSTVETVSCDQR